MEIPARFSANFEKQRDNIQLSVCFHVQLAPSEKGSTLKGKKCSCWEQILSFKSRPLSEGRQKTSRESVSIVFKNWQYGP